MLQSVREASALLAAYEFYPDKYMDGTKPDPSELSVMTSVIHELNEVLVADPFIRDESKHPKSLEDLRRLYRISYGMSRSRFKKALNTLVVTANHTEATYQKRLALQEAHTERELNDAIRGFLD